MAGVPSNIIIPFMGIDFDSSQAGSADSTVPIKLLTIGQRTSNGSVDEAIVYQATSPATVGANSGFDSMLYRQAVKAFENNQTVDAYFVALDDAATATDATYVWTLSGTATASGEYVAYVAGQRYAVGVAIGDAAADIQVLMTAAINAVSASNPQLPCTAADDAAGEETLTLNNGGIAAGDLDVRFHANSGEALPAGLTLTTVTATAGTVDPDIGDALAALGADWYNVINQPYTDNTNMTAMEEYLDTVNGVMEMRDGMCYQAKRDTRANMITFGEDVANRNSEWMVTLPAYQRFESTYELSAAVAAATAVSIQDDPAVPLHRITLKGITVLDTNHKWTSTERNQLAQVAIATLTDEIGVQTEATVTMYLQNSAGASDTAYQYQNTMFILSAARYRFRNQILTKYPRAKLATNADNIGPGQQVMTLDTARDEAVAWFKEGQRDGIFEPSTAALTQFKNALEVSRDDDNVNRVNWILPPDLMNQFIVGSATIQFRQ